MYLRRPRVRYALLLVVVGFALVASLREVWGGQRRAGRAAAAGQLTPPVSATWQSSQSGGP